MERFENETHKSVLEHDGAIKCANTVGLQNSIRSNKHFDKDGHCFMRPVPAENKLRPPGADGTHMAYQGKAA